MTLWQNGGDDFEYLLPNVSNPNYYDWIVSTKKDFSAQSSNNGTVFFLAAYLPGSTSPFTCHYFNITDAGSSSLLSTTSAASTPHTTTTVQTTTPSIPSETTVLVTLNSDTSSVTTATGISSSPPPTTMTSPPPTATATNVELDAGLSSSTKIGMGVGIGVGVPALITLGVFVGWMLRASTRRRKPSTMSHGAHHSWISLDKHCSPCRPRLVHEALGHIEELAGPYPAYELPPVASRRGSYK
ncbi:hypothetical protein MMC30_004851 [Trapelia coarctata]|nr:hypothetical protein [Trapelia coarctata]